MSDDGVTVTENEPRPSRPDSTAERDAAETRATEIVQDFGKGLISRSSATKVRDAAQRSISGHDLSRGINNLP